MHAIQLVIIRKQWKETPKKYNSNLQRQIGLDLAQFATRDNDHKMKNSIRSLVASGAIHCQHKNHT